MNLSPQNFNEIPQNLISQYISILDNLDERLSVILRKELSNGNKIGSVSIGWPAKKGLIVEMVGKMDLLHELPNGVHYNHINDPHYWMHEYTTFNGEDTTEYDLIVCGDHELSR